jgi:CHAD domain
VKARKVRDLDPDGTLADNAERIVRVRLDELCGFMPQAADPAEIVALHDMRIAAKRLRYVLEVTGPCFGPYAETATKHVKAVQDLLGEIHDCDEQVPVVQALAERLRARDAAALVAAAGDAEDLDPALLRRAPHGRDHAGLAALETQLRARRALLFARFLELWNDLERKGFRGRLEFAVSERAGAPPAAPAVDFVAAEPAGSTSDLAADDADR